MTTPRVVGATRRPPLSNALGVSIYPLTADVPCTPHRAPAHLAFGGSRHADTINSCPKGATPKGDSRGHAVRLLKWHGRHSLRRCCDGQGKGSESDQPDHFVSP